MHSLPNSLDLIVFNTKNLVSQRGIKYQSILSTLEIDRRALNESIQNVWLDPVLTEIEF